MWLQLCVKTCKLNYNTQVDNVQYTDAAIPIYNLVEFSDIN